MFLPGDPSGLFLFSLVNGRQLFPGLPIPRKEDKNFLVILPSPLKITPRKIPVAPTSIYLRHLLKPLEGPLAPRV